MSGALTTSSSRWRATVLGGWTAGLAAILIAGRYSLFIRAELWPLLLASVIILALFLIAMFARPGHGTGRVSAGAWVRGGMILLPIIYMGSLMSGSAASGLNSFALQKRSLGLGTSTDSFGFGGASDASPIDTSKSINLGTIIRNVNRLNGTHIATEGRVWMDPSLASGQMVIFRFIVVCCAADAMPVQVVVESPKTVHCQDDQWVHVEGTLTLVKHEGGLVPTITADQITVIPAPDEPYLSPYQF
jgi:putative membrane protein